MEFPSRINNIMTLYSSSQPCLPATEGCKPVDQSSAIIIQIKLLGHILQGSIYLWTFVHCVVEYYQVGGKKEEPRLRQLRQTSSQFPLRLASSASGGNEASCVSSLIWELNNFPCGAAISSFRLYSQPVRWVERREQKTSTLHQQRVAIVSPACHTQTLASHREMVFFGI